MVDHNLVFLSGGSSEQCLTVTVLHDRLVEEEEHFTLSASSDDLRLTLQPRTVNFTITDEDGKFQQANSFTTTLSTCFISSQKVICGEVSMDTSRGYFAWPETFPGESAEVQCVNAVTTRVCSSAGLWEKPFITDCYVSTAELFRYLERVSVLENLPWH